MTRMSAVEVQPLLLHSTAATMQEKQSQLKSQFVVFLSFSCSTNSPSPGPAVTRTQSQRRSQVSTSARPAVS